MVKISEIPEKQDLVIGDKLLVVSNQVPEGLLRVAASNLFVSHPISSQRFLVADGTESVILEPNDVLFWISESSQPGFHLIAPENPALGTVFSIINCTGYSVYIGQQNFLYLGYEQTVEIRTQSLKVDFYYVNNSIGWVSSINYF